MIWKPGTCNFIIKLHYSHGFPWHSLGIYPYHPLLPTGLLDDILCLYKAVLGKFLLVSQHWHVHVRMSLLSSSLLLQQYPACLVHLIWMVFKMGGRWPYNSCFVVCVLQDLFSITHSIFVQFLSSFFSICFVSVHVVHPYSRMDTNPAWKKLYFIG